MTSGKRQADEKKGDSLRETLSPNDISSFCKTFERAIFLSIQKRAGYKDQPQHLYNDPDLVTKGM